VKAVPAEAAIAIAIGVVAVADVVPAADREVTAVATPAAVVDAEEGRTRVERTLLSAAFDSDLFWNGLMKGRSDAAFFYVIYLTSELYPPGNEECRFDVAGPFKLTRHGQKKLITKQSTADLRPQLENWASGLFGASGCYVFAIHEGRGYTPYYVGQACKRSMLLEALNPSNTEKYNSVCSERDANLIPSSHTNC